MALSKSGKRYVMSVATKDEGYFRFFLESCKRNNIDPVLLGKGAEWKGYGTKFRLMKEWIDNLEDEDCVLIVDCYDLIFVRPVDSLFDKFEQLASCCGDPKQYIYTASECDDMFGPVIRFFHGTYKDAIINSGSFIAYAAFLKRLVNDEAVTLELQNNPRCDDQQLLIKYLNEHKEVICDLDANRRFIVYQKMGVQIGARLRIDNGVVTYVGDKTTYRPYLIHRCNNGDMINILSQLGYDTDGFQVQTGHLGRVLNIHLPNYIDHVRKWLLQR